MNREIPEIPEAYPEHGMFGRLPAYGFYCRHAENMTFNDIELDFIEPDARPSIVFDDISGLELYKVKAKVVDNASLIQCKDVKNMFVQSCIAPRSNECFLQISGAKSEHITLIGNDLSGARNAVKKDESIEVFYDSNRMK